MNLVLTSERLLLRPFAETDVDVEVEIGTDPEIMKYVGAVETKDQIIRNMAKYTRRCADGCIGVWCVIERATNEKLGTAILLPLPIDEADTNWHLVAGEGLPEGDIEIGYMLRKPAWGKGYATEVCRRLLKFAFEETPLEEIVAVTDPNNTASQHVLEKCGLPFDGMRRAYGEQCTGYRITRRQWREQTV
jgi:ribosomal-protein-alanine N-acetyltransferase